MDPYLLLKTVHVIGATVLLGTGAGIAFFMVMANRTANPVLVAHVTRTVVVADLVFTATAVVLQPMTGMTLARMTHQPLLHGWIGVSLALYVLVGVFWLPVVWMQSKMHELAAKAVEDGEDLPPEYHRLYRRWFACGFPAFAAVLGIIWLMVAKPSF